MAHDLATVTDPFFGNGWRAELELGIELRSEGSLLTRRRHLGPLRVQRAFYPEGPAVCHVFLLHPPGGLVPGDELDIEIGVGPDARGLVTTPAAAKIYRSDGRRAAQRQRLSVAQGGILEWLPQETIVFDGALADLETSVALEDGAGFVGWDVLCLGRPAIGERFRTGGCRTGFEIHRGNTPLYIDRSSWRGGSDVLFERYGLAGHAAFGTLLAVGPKDPLREVARELASSSREFVTATLLADGEVLCCRYVGPSAAGARERFAEIWGVLRPRLFGRPAVAPRIWAT